MTIYNETDLIEILQEMFEEEAYEGGRIEDYRTFEEAGILTTNKGLVVITELGEYQITIVKSR